MGPRFRPHFETLHVLFLMVWLCMLFGAGMGAAVAFPQIKKLDPALPEYASFTGEHWKIAGGHIGNTLFVIADKAQIISAIGALLTLALVMKARGLTAARGYAVARVVLVGLATAIAIYHVFVLSPKMMSTIQEFWAAARAGDMAKATPLQATFDSYHPASRLTLESTWVTLVIALLVSVFDAARGPVVITAEPSTRRT
ncbi:MAG: hypothetical protein L6Q35_15280 [Phycisphaerales bacterium]|nr:hypothetical protein [Phycisphaerales bacterium]